MLDRFGQEVRLEIYSDKELSNLVLDTGGLRVDFHIKIIPGLNRAKFSIFNLNTEYAREVTNGVRYVKLFVRLHDNRVEEFENIFYVNNALNIKRVPEKVTELYCVDKLRNDFTYKQVRFSVKTPTLKRVCNKLAEVTGTNINFDYKDIPDDLRDYVPVNPEHIWSGDVKDSLDKIAKAYNCKWVERPNNTIKFLYLPVDRNQHNSKQNDTTKYYKLQTRNMRANPKIGIANMEVYSNLDFNINPGTLFDTSELLTADSKESLETLALLNNAIKSSMSGNAIYQVLTIEHKGSNYTQEWSTAAMAVKAFKGTTTPTYNWF